METLSIQACEEDQGKRADALLAEKFPQFSRSLLAGFKDSFTINGKPGKFSHKVKAGDTLSIQAEKVIQLHHVEPEAIPVPIVYEDEHVLVVNKPYGMVVHPAKGNWSGTLVNAVYGHLTIDSDEDLRPGIVHRLDKDTSGLMVIAKNLDAQHHLMDQFAERTVLKIYHALVLGYLKYSVGEMNGPLARHAKNRLKYAVDFENGKEAFTEYKVLKQFEKASLVELTLHTGRTHQIRVHLAHEGAPIIGDKLYNRKFHEYPMCLISKKLGFTHPATEEWMEFEIDYTEDFEKTLKIFQDKK